MNDRQLMNNVDCKFTGRVVCQLAFALALLGGSLTAPAMAQLDELAGTPAANKAQASLSALSNPAVRAAVELPRNKPADYLRATLNLINLGEPELAKQAMDELIALGINKSQQAALVREFGAATLLRIVRTPELGEAVAPFANECLAAAAAQAASPERIQKLLTQLSKAGVNRNNAVAELAGIGKPTVLPCMALLHEAHQNGTSAEGAQAALLRLKPYSAGPLLAALDGPYADQAAKLLAHFGTSQAAPRLALRAASPSSSPSIAAAYERLTQQKPSVESAEGLLQRTLKNLLEGVPAFHADDQGNVFYWVWNLEAGQPALLLLTSDEATLLYRTRLASDLASLRPNRVRNESLALRLDIEATALLQAVGMAVKAKASGELANLPVAMLNQTLRDALADQQPAAAMAVLQAIGHRKDASLLTTSDGRPSPTALALQSAYPSVRLAAVETIAAIDPEQPFPGASYVCPAIAHFASSTGEREVVVAAPKIYDATTWGGGLASVGLVGQAASTGQEAIRLASERADVELVLIDMAIGRPGVREVVFQLRRNPATSLLPIGLLAREPQYRTARRIATEHHGVMSFPRPHTDAALTSLALELSAKLPRRWPSAAERRKQSARAIAAMDQLLTKERHFYRLRAAINAIAGTLRPDRATPEAWSVLAQAGTYRSQQALVEFANTISLAIDHRQAAVNAFDRSVQKFGLLLSSKEIARQYDLYNGSKAQPKESQQLLGNLLDTIESHRKEQNKKR